MVTYRHIDVNGVKIAYREAGRSGARQVVLLHGFLTSSHMYRELIPALADDYQVIGPDYSGLVTATAPSEQRCLTRLTLSPTSSSDLSRLPGCTASVSLPKAMAPPCGSASRQHSQQALKRSSPGTAMLTKRTSALLEMRSASVGKSQPQRIGRTCARCRSTTLPGFSMSLARATWS
jgi:hypothetical protein